MTTPWQSIDSFLSNLGIRVGAPTLGQTTGGTHVADSEHYAGRARDYGWSDSDVAAITRALVPYATGPNYTVDELFDSRDNTFFKNGQPFTPDPALRQEHYSHVHVGLRPGAELGGLASPVATGGQYTATPAGFPGSGIVGNLVGGPIKTLIVQGVAIAGGVALIALGAWRGVKPKEITQ